ncbi:hypothetical protein HDK90DRAFT_235541 [Phyllosticta capitalensis]|uniref:Uncharacterized protein n=1 Tax=Phyllosticta capitalensis TaxID=121624 RepID=A0ABR1YNX2_9PEZI
MTSPMLLRLMVCHPPAPRHVSWHAVLPAHRPTTPCPDLEHRTLVSPLLSPCPPKLRVLPVDVESTPGRTSWKPWLLLGSVLGGGRLENKRVMLRCFAPCLDGLAGTVRFACIGAASRPWLAPLARSLTSYPSLQHGSPSFEHTATALRCPACTEGVAPGVCRSAPVPRTNVRVESAKGLSGRLCSLLYDAGEMGGWRVNFKGMYGEHGVLCLAMPCTVYTK